MRALLDAQAIATSPAVAFAPVPVNVQHSAVIACTARSRSTQRRRAQRPAQLSDRAPALARPRVRDRPRVPGREDACARSSPSCARRCRRSRSAILVVDDGSTDGTAAIAGERRLPASSRTARTAARARRSSPASRRRARAVYDVALTVDADGQHPADEARRVLARRRRSRGARARHPRSRARRRAAEEPVLERHLELLPLALRRPRAPATRSAGSAAIPSPRRSRSAPRGEGYDFEAEVLLRAIWAGVPIVEEPVRVLYPEDRATHFHVVRDPWRIVRTVVRRAARSTQFGQRRARDPTFARRHKKKLIALARARCSCRSIAHRRRRPRSRGSSRPHARAGASLARPRRTACGAPAAAGRRSAACGSLISPERPRRSAPSTPRSSATA